MARIIYKHNTGTAPVGTGTVKFIKSGHTPDYSLDDWLINPDLSSVNGNNIKYWKIVENQVLLMTVEEQALVNAEIVSVQEAATVSASIANSRFIGYIEDLSESSTTSTNDQTKLTLTANSLIDGVQYNINWFCEIHASGNNEILAMVYLNGNEISRSVHYEANYFAVSDNYRPFSGHHYSNNLSGENIIEIKYRDTHFGGSSVKIRRAWLLIEKV